MVPWETKKFFWTKVKNNFLNKTTIKTVTVLTRNIVIVIVIVIVLVTTSGESPTVRDYLSTA